MRDALALQDTWKGYIGGACLLLRWISVPDEVMKEKKERNKLSF